MKRNHLRDTEVQSEIPSAGDCSHEIKRRSLLGRKVMTNLDSLLKSRGIALPTEVRLVKAMVFPVVTYGCVLDLKKAECQSSVSKLVPVKLLFQ